MARLLLLMLSAALGACATTNEFDRLDPERVAVVIGYEVAGSPSFDPKMLMAISVGSVLIPGIPALALLTGTAVVIEKQRTDDAITMVDELNDAVYRGVEADLVAKGYTVSLLKKVAVPYEKWRSDRIHETYLARIGSRYQLTESELRATGADTVLYLEYRVDANVKDMEELQSMNAIDLKVDLVQRNAMAFSLPPRNRLMFRSRLADGPVWNRLSFDTTLAFLTDLDNWPDRNN